MLETLILLGILLYFITSSFAFDILRSKGQPVSFSLAIAFIPIFGLITSIAMSDTRIYRPKVFTIGRLFTKFIFALGLEVVLFIDASYVFPSLIDFITNETVVKYIHTIFLIFTVIEVIMIVFDYLMEKKRGNLDYYDIKSSVFRGMGVCFLLVILLIDISIFIPQFSTIISLQIFFLIITLIVIQALAQQITASKNLENKLLVNSLVPIIGLVNAIKSDSNNEKFTLGHVLNLKNVVVKFFSYSVVSLVTFIDVGTIINWIITIFPHTIVMTALQGFFLIVTYFVIQSITYEILINKGYRKAAAAGYSLIPYVSIIIAIKSQPLKEVRNNFIRIAYSIKEITLKLLIYGELALVATAIFLPLIYIVGASLSTSSQLPNTFLPDKLTFDNYKTLFQSQKESGIYFGKWYWNTLQIALVNTVGGVLFITGAAYVFSRFKFKGKKFGLITILVLQIFPSFMGLVAMYVLFKTFNMLDQPLALSILYIGGSIPFNLWLIKGYLQNIPKELDESAMIDGANKFQIFFHIILPLSVPILSFVAVSLFMAPWMDYILPGLLLNQTVSGVTKEKRWTVAVGLFSLIKGDSVQYTTFAAGAIIVALPITILYLVFQKYLVEGITAGSTKG